VRVRCDLGAQVGRLAVECLVGRAGRIAVLDALVGPGLTGLWPSRLGIVLASLCPPGGEASIEDATRIQRRCRRVDRGEWRDRLEVRGVELGCEELADGAVGDPDHPDLVPEHPRLMGDGLDHVVAVEVLQRFEVVEGTT